MEMILGDLKALHDVLWPTSRGVQPCYVRCLWFGSQLTHPALPPSITQQSKVLSDLTGASHS